MNEREQVIANLLFMKRDCLEGSDTDQTIDRAVKLLTEQEPRVLTLEEVKQAEGRDVWLELSGIFAETALTAATIEGCGTKGICTRYESLKYTQYCVRPYGWRCWSARPTDAQRKAVRWNDSGRMGERF